RQDSGPMARAAPGILPPLFPGYENVWVTQELHNHPTLKHFATALEIAQLETQRAQAANKPTLDLNGSYGKSYNEGSSASRLDSRTNIATVALAFNLPLFAGFSIQNRVREALALEDKARTDLEAARRNVSQNPRVAFFGVSSGLGQVKALEAAEASSQSALDANKLGYQVGVRIIIDVLNAQSQLFQTKRDLAKARYDVLVGGLRLRQANGSLTPEDLRAINSLLVK
ncbi:MAG: TolC family protein, partial [Rhodoferax sp.]|nr:TolC family protein [Rhodoferax sp.]